MMTRRRALMFSQATGGSLPYTMTIISELILSANANLLLTTQWSDATAFTFNGSAFVLTNPVVINASYRNMATPALQAEVKSSFLILGNTGTGAVMYYIPGDVTCDYYHTTAWYSRVSGNIQMYTIP